MRINHLRRVVAAGAVGALALTGAVGVGTAAAVDYTLPSLWQSYKDDFTMGTFGNWNSQQALYHYRANSIPNNLKLDSQIGTSATNSLSRQAYVAKVAQINADTTLTADQKAAAIETANQQIVLQPTTGNGQAEQILQAIQAYNATLPADQKKVVRGHVFAWHGGQQPNWFFTNGFYYDAANPDWASPQTMLKRLDNYIHAMTDKYAKYSDVIVAWDVVNESIDDYTGQIRNADDAQVGQWGRIFRRPDLDGDPDARLTAESAWVRQAFESARKWENAAGVHWKLYYNDYQDSDKLYEPKESQTIKLLKPIHDAGNIDGYGMQGRLAWAYPTIDMLRKQINAGLTVANEISITESDIRSDFEPNPDYDPSQPTRRVTEADGADPAHQWPTYGSCSWANRSAANGNTFDVCNSPVRRIPAWGTGANDALANSPDIMRKQADFAADWMDLLLSYKGKIALYDWDGTNDTSTFNRNTGGHLWSGLSGNPEKYSFFAVIGAPAREKLRDAIARVSTLVPATYPSDAWAKVVAARDAAQALVSPRIYSIDGVNAVKNATAALTDAIGAYQATTAGGTVGGDVPATLALTLGGAATFPAFVPGVANDYTATTTANVLSTAGDATLSVSDPGFLTNGAFALSDPLKVAFSKSTWTAPVANDPVTVTFSQHIGDTQPLRTGTYSKTLTFTLSTTTP
ncbi:glycosyl hydrolase family 10 [Solirubrobacter pauli]|uniref:Beta-xylanase n=1 Tax=Solirubrobacter pauli TaxID=166793 RepID=A0A660LD09_9ACTN|nr:endo-1,4-beta-xylanase [Solirubrobacter pauli]RKQ92166.1 glycosyl hydrolase family 10 [Solirubrobacter pauli]